MTKIWVASDHHFNHRNILNFKNYDGSPVRTFKDLTEMNEEMVRRHNEVVKREDHVYFLGDFSINRAGLQYATRMMGHKRLVRGNHDIFRTKEYIEVGFDEIYGCRVWPKHNMIFTHIPLHPDCLSGRGWLNIHGHLHGNLIMESDKKTPDKRYRNVCVEHTDFYPVLLME